MTTTLINQQVKDALLQVKPNLQKDWDNGHTETLVLFQVLIT